MYDFNDNKTRAIKNMCNIHVSKCVIEWVTVLLLTKDHILEKAALTAGTSHASYARHAAP